MEMQVYKTEPLQFIGVELFKMALQDFIS